MTNNPLSIVNKPASSGVPAHGGAPAAARGRNTPQPSASDRTRYFPQIARPAAAHVGRQGVLRENDPRYPPAATHAAAVQSGRRRRHVRASVGEGSLNLSAGVQQAI